MQFSVSVARRGLNLDLFAKNFQGEVAQRLVEETADFAFEQMYSNAPWRSGFLAQSIKKEVGEGRVDIKPLASYAVFVEKGTAPHIIRPINAGVLRLRRGCWAAWCLLGWCIIRVLRRIRLLRRRRWRRGMKLATLLSMCWMRLWGKRQVNWRT